MAFTPISEWSRLLTAHADEWRISYLNKDYKVCNSYPSAVIVPRHIDDEVIISSANFRDGGRFPVLCYRHEGGVWNTIIQSSKEKKNIYISWPDEALMNVTEHFTEKQSAHVRYDW